MGFEGTCDAKADSCAEDDAKMGVVLHKGICDLFRKASP